MNSKIILPLFLLTTLLFNSGCLKDECTRTITYTQADAIYLSPENYRIDIELSSPKTLEDQGKIYFYHDYILVNERNEGIHIIDNASPENPQNIGFIPIPGNVDMAVKNGILYADNYTDLLAIDISDIMNPQIRSRSEMVFPHFGENQAGELLVRFEYTQITEEVSCDSWRGGGWLGGPTIENSSAGGDFNNNNSGGIGQGGSLARFTIAGDHLYTVDEQSMHVFNIEDGTSPAQTNTVELGWGIETIFPYENKLFIGSNTGMQIYSIDQPNDPSYLGGYDHWTSCDPVFVKDNFAYVTLRSGTLCNGSTLNQLDLLDISNISNPVLVESFEMDNPHGLSIDENNLFLCEGEHGLKVFDIEKPRELDRNRIEFIKSIHAVDVIALPSEANLLLVIGKDGLYQYNYDNPENLKLLSFIPIAQ